MQHCEATPRLDHAGDIVFLSGPESRVVIAMDSQVECHGFNILKDNWGRWKQHSRTLRGSFMARRKPRVLTLGQS
ncbi:hypothetical protein TNCV_3241321 [Trichonephila clavipes]|nr:hypothetical protein TNCV_3241321 [Trichonephila clavipes]